MNFAFISPQFIYIYPCLVLPSRTRTPYPPTSTNLMPEPSSLVCGRLTSTSSQSRDLSRCAVSSPRLSTVLSRTANAQECPDRREKRKQTLLPINLLNWSRKIKICVLRSSTLNWISPTSIHPWAASRPALTTRLHAQCTANHSHALPNLRK